MGLRNHGYDVQAHINSEHVNNPAACEYHYPQVEPNGYGPCEQKKPDLDPENEIQKISKPERDAQKFLRISVVFIV